jgi:hypothetical protein
MKLPALLSLAALAACGASDLTHPTDLPHQANADLDWRDQVIYQIVVDRFANGDPNNDTTSRPSVPAATTAATGRA